ncbi:MAG: hypothetical protein Kapaf2KO_21560 [Candidatus Kapaibacteriales bacterium]
MKIIITIIALIFLLPEQGFARLQGQDLIDSLEAELPKAKGDTNEVKLLSSLSSACRYIDIMKAGEYAYKGNDLAHKLDFRNGLSITYNSIASFYGIRSEYDSALYNFKKVLQINIEQNELSAIANAYGNIALVYENSFNYDSSIKYNKKALELYQELEMKERVAKHYMRLAHGYHNLNDTINTEKNYNKAYKVYESLNDMVGMGRIISDKGVIQNRLGNLSKSLEYHLEALKLFEAVNSNQYQALSLGNVGSIYKALEEYDKALEYYIKAKDIYVKLGLEQDIADSYFTLANIYFDLDRRDSALASYHTAKEQYRFLNNRRGEADALANIGTLYTSPFSNYIPTLQDHHKAISYLTKALKINTEINDEYSRSFNLYQIGFVYLNIYLDFKENQHSMKYKEAINNVDIGIKYLEEAYEILNVIGNIGDKMNLLKDLSEAYSYKNDYKKEVELLKKHYILRDSLFNIDKAKEIGKLEAQREQLEAEYAQEEAARVEQEEIVRRNNLQYSIISIVTIIIFAIIFYFVRRNISFGAIDTLTFVAFLLLYEFVLVLTEPWVDDITDNVPIYKLLINIGFALLLIPLQKIEQRLKRKFASNEDSV